MRMTFRRPSNLVIGSVLALLVTLTIASSVLLDMFRSNNYTPHGYCILWDQRLLWLNVVNDLVIGVSYVSIAATLTYLVYRGRESIPFHWILLAFGAFIIACGGTHFIEVWTFWSPVYWLAGNIKLVTAIASVTTAVVLPPLVPQMLNLIHTAKISQQRKLQLEHAHAELEQLYRQVKELDALKTSFFANVSHELRTPLALIMGPVEQLLHTDNLTPESRQQLTLIHRNANLLRRRVNDLLDIVRLETGQMRFQPLPTNLARLIRGTVSHFDGIAQARQIRLLVEAPESLIAEADGAKFQQALINLLSNAFAFAPIGGIVRIRLGVQASEVIMSVEDSGPGVRPELRDIIFERFRRGDDSLINPLGGTGLGLSIVRSLVELHNGTIRVHDSVLGGADFTIRMPYQMTEAIPELLPTRDLPLIPLEFVLPPSPEPQPQSGQSLVLVVEDNHELRQFLVLTLARYYRVATATDGQAGLNQALALRPDLVLTDMMMPNLSGDQLIRALRTHREFDNIPIVVLSARTDDALRVQALEEGAQDYLVKPFATAELLARIDNLIAMKLAREALQRAVESQSQNIRVLAEQLDQRQRELEEQAREQTRLYDEAREALHQRDTFMAIAAHELRTPLTALMGTAQLMQRRAMRNDSDERSRRSVQVIVDQSIRMSSLVNRLLDLSRIEQGRFTIDPMPLNLTTLVQRITDEIQQTLDQHTMKLLVTDEPLQILGDALRLEQVLHNLIGNAVKYSPQGGLIQVTVEREGDDSCITITDNGIGIPQAALAKLFTRFYRAPNVDHRQISGMGLGLYIVQTIVSLHDGSITASSVEGEGSTFVVRLPLHSLTASAEVVGHVDLTN